MPFLLAEILNFQGSTHRIGVGSFSNSIKNNKQALSSLHELFVCKLFNIYID